MMLAGVTMFSKNERYRAVITAGNYNASDAELWGDEILTEYVFPSMGLPEMNFVPNAGE